MNGGLPNGVENPYIKSATGAGRLIQLDLSYTLNRFYDRYQIPLFIVENGFGAVDTVEEDGSIHDPERIQYLKSHIEALRKSNKLRWCGFNWLYAVGNHRYRFIHNR